MEELERVAEDVIDAASLEELEKLDETASMVAEPVKLAEDVIDAASLEAIEELEETKSIADVIDADSLAEVVEMSPEDSEDDGDGTADDVVETLKLSDSDNDDDLTVDALALSVSDADDIVDDVSTCELELSCSDTVADAVGTKLLEPEEVADLELELLSETSLELDDGTCPGREKL